ncbi:MAG: AMP-binding protein [Candidatus Omnitrophota bacterium]|jgi:acyl-CoA synthetase (AMP-forming)/AMP-acid ligase II
MITNLSQSVWDNWEDHAKNFPESEAIVHWDALAEPFRWSYGNLLNEALKIADNLIRQGVDSGDVCALIIRHNKYFYPIYMGIVAIGAIPAVLAYPNARLHPDKFIYGLSGIAQKSGLSWVMTERELEPTIKPLVLNKQNSIKGILLPLESIDDEQTRKFSHKIIEKKRDNVTASSPFLLQHSSGTTGLQKAVVLSHRAVLEHTVRYSEAIKLTSKDKVISWLPLYHDMGLIAAFHLPLIFGIPSIQIDPFQWVSAPAIFLQAISEEKPTLTWLPNFAYNFMADRIPEEEMENVNLSSIRMFINCSEVICAESHEKFFNRFQKYKVKKQSLSACYAMAETTFAVTQTESGFEATSLLVDRNALAKEIIRSPQNKFSKKICVSSGKPISGCSLKIVNKNGDPLPEDCVGKIAIKSISLFDGYRNNPEKTNLVLKDGWYLSGDLGFCHKGEYFVIGREDDVIIVAGNNIYPEDIEDAMSKIAGVTPGRVIAFGAYDSQTGTEDVYVIAETSYEAEKEKDSLVLAIKEAGMGIDVTISKVLLVPPRWLIKSSSGKPSRKANKERILTDTI